MNRGTKGLEMWCRRQIEGYPGVEIHNMTTSWKNGMAFCALVHHFRPDLIDFDKLNKADVYDNNDLAFRLAEEHLGIPALLDAADMAMYDVPDRLSILTYLSQYYQRFASQESKIIKDKSATIANTTPPPQKMAHIAGVPKREPCKHCGLPVFFAERIAIDGAFYHRKCLRCARCESQLTLGSFYETEVDGVFCCETCPDEEKKIRLGNNNDEPIGEQLSPQVADEQRQSFSDKLAMFQTNGKGLLQKSLSDEEKSKSLKRLTEMYSKNCAHDANDVNQTISESNDRQIDVPTTTTNTAEPVNDVQAATSSGSSENDDKPPLPTTLPPSPTVDTAKPKQPPVPSKANVLNKLYGKTEENPITFDPKLKPQISAKPSIVANEQPSKSEQIDKSANEENQSETPNAPETVSSNAEKVNTIGSNLNTHNSLPLDALNSSTNVTKENAEFIEASQHNDNVHRLEDKIDSNNIDDVDDDDDDDSKNVEQGTNTKNVIQLEGAIQNEHNDDNDCDPGKKQLEQNEQQCVTENDCNEIENKSIDTDIDKNDTNEREHSDDTTLRNSSISDNDSQKMVRSRLSQFEALVQSSTEQKQTPHHSPRLNQSSDVAETVAEETAKKTSIDVDEKIHGPDDTEPIKQLNAEPCLPSAEVSSIANEENHVNLNESINADSVGALNASDTIKPVPRQRVSVNVNLYENPPTPTKRRTKPDKLIDKPEMSEDISNNLDIQQRKKSESSLNIMGTEPKSKDTEYPDDLNPFGSDDEDEIEEQKDILAPIPKRKDSLNPFDSSDDEVELLKDTNLQQSTPRKSNKNHRISTNPFGSDSEDENELDTDSLSSKRTPVPTPRKPLNGSTLHATPEASPRMYNTLNPKMRLRSSDEFRGSNASLASSSTAYTRQSYTMNRSSQIHGSMSSLASTPRHRKGRAPDIPTAKTSLSASSSPSHSVRATPISRKKRAAPLPPSLREDHTSPNQLNVTSTLDDSLSSRHTVSSESVVDLEHSLNFSASSESNYVSSSNDASIPLSGEPAYVNGIEFKISDLSSEHLNESTPRKLSETSTSIQRKLIPVDISLLDDLASRSIVDMAAEEEVTYRRKIIPDEIITPIKSEPSLTDRQCEKMKENKESKNRQSQIVLPAHMLDDTNQMYSPNKSSYGKWKRRKGPAPSLPIPPRKVIQMLPLQEIRHELEVIEVQQQGLEKQGIMLEKMIRERCEGTENENQPLSECKPNSKEVEDLILQLFELVNEKNELFRRQAELMYLRRQHRLEQEQADIEYEIRVLMAQPECNKTDSDKAREEALISRLVDVVQLRNAVIESLEMDRIREAEEDQSIKERLELHTAKRDEELCQHTPIKLSKKEKKKQKESKKLAKQKKMDADKDADESELSLSDKSKEKKKKKKFLF